MDTNQGALYRSNDTVYSSMPGSDAHVNGLSALDTEISERLEILKNAGLMSDLDITRVYIREGEICWSLLRSVLGTAVGVVKSYMIQSSEHAAVGDDTGAGADETVFPARFHQK